jgi:AraC-like DNA-binding protein
VAPLSLHAVLRGREIYETRAGRHAVEPGRYLVLNAGQEVRTDVPGAEAVDSVSVMFEDAFAREVLTSLSTPLDRLLDDPEARSPAGVVFFERTYPVDAALEGWLRRDGEEGEEDEERHHALLGLLLAVHRGLRPQVDRLPALRPATRAEIYRRLARARDFVDASWAEPLRLSTMARVAGIAPHRFLRLFKQAFGQTPHRYLTERRLQEARRRLEAGDARVTDVCLAVGFTSVGSFSTLYRRRFGGPPGRAIFEKPARATRP